MTSNPLCAACRQIFRVQCRRTAHSSSKIYRAQYTPSICNTPRLFSTNGLQSASQATPKASRPTPLEYQPKSPPTNAESKEGPNPAAPSQGKQSDTPSKDTSSINPTTATIGTELRKRLPTELTETYIAYGACETLLKECARQADYTVPQVRQKGVEVPKTKDQEDLGVGTGWWYETLGLTPTFNTWAQITFLHMYVLTCRLRCFSADNAPIWHQHLLDHFFYNAEDRMVLIHNIAARSIRQKYLKDLFTQWRGLLAGYDEGLVKGDAVLATAVWRNIFNANPDVDFRGVGEVVSYIRGVLKGLDEMPDESIASGKVVFGDPGSERDGVLLRSRMMTEQSGPVVLGEAVKAARA